MTTWPSHFSVGQTLAGSTCTAPPPHPGPLQGEGILPGLHHWLTSCTSLASSSLFFSQVFIPNKYFAPQIQSLCLLLENPVCNGGCRGWAKGVAHGLSNRNGAPLMPPTLRSWCVRRSLFHSPPTLPQTEGCTLSSRHHRDASFIPQGTPEPSADVISFAALPW